MWPVGVVVSISCRRPGRSGSASRPLSHSRLLAQPPHHRTHRTPGDQRGRSKSVPSQPASTASPCQATSFAPDTPQPRPSRCPDRPQRMLGAGLSAFVRQTRRCSLTVPRPRAAGCDITNVGKPSRGPRLAMRASSLAATGPVRRSRKVEAMTCLVCKSDTVEGHCPRTRPACAWYRCISCTTVIDVARRILWLPSHRVVRYG